jgi:hypothetical protein
MPSEALRELILSVAEIAANRSLLFFIERFGVGRMAMTGPVDREVWKLLAEDERMALLRRDNHRMDSAMMARHLARILLAPGERDLADAGKQVALLGDPEFVALHGRILKSLGGGSEGDRVRPLYDAVTLAFARLVAQGGAEREEAYREIREKIRGCMDGACPPAAGRENAMGRQEG